MHKIMKHVLQSQQFDRPRLEHLFEQATVLRQAWQKDKKALRNLFPGEVLCNLFYEVSTRTRISFELAAKYLGMDVVGTEDARTFSSAVKGETLEDTIRVLCGYGIRVIVIRHSGEGSASRASSVCDQFGVSVINAGDGCGQHPTQSLLDLYTIQNEKQRIDGLTVAIGGDLSHGRTARSLAYLLSRFSGVKIMFVAPQDLQIGEDILTHLTEHGVPFVLTDKMDEALPVADVVYWTRLQKERLQASEGGVKTPYLLDRGSLTLMKSDAIILHPLPRTDELSNEVDDDPRAVYFRQAENGLFIRMGLLQSILGTTS
jgi:aspartate carbamoyltransferase catalytic subunit